MRRKKHRARKVSRITIMLIALILFVAASITMYQIIIEKKTTSRQLKAIIIDPLAVDFPNKTVITELTQILRKSGFSVDYIGGSNVTVNALKEILSKGGYKVIIIRSHGAKTIGHLPPNVASSAIFTGETFNDRKYVGFLSAGLVGKGIPLAAPNKQYFVITSLFVETYAHFHNTVVIIAGCYILDDPRLAQAFIKKGASVVIGWKGEALLRDSDRVLVRLVKYLFLSRMSIEEAVLTASLNTGITIGVYPRSKEALSVWDVMK